MGEISGKESSVLIENVSVVINVFNVGHGGIGQTPTVTQVQCQRPTVDFIPNCLADFSLVSLEDGRLDPSNVTVVTEGTPTPEDSNNLVPLGWIACYSGDVIPFGVQPTSNEIPTFGEKETWKEIRVCLPPSILVVDNTEADLYCPVLSCREKLPKNKSIDYHIKKHLGLGESINNVNQEKLPCPLFYYCQDKTCQYNVESAEKHFKAYKNVKQHYMKVHAPKLFECDSCQKTFSTLKTAETHKLMCGEKYSCSTCNASYNSLEALQTHCRRKGHVYDHLKYKDKRNSVKHEMQLQSSKMVSPPTPTTTAMSFGGRRQKPNRKLPVILPKASSNSDGVFSTIQALCQQAGVKVDYGCQTVCTAFVQKSSPVEAVITSASPAFSQKKRKSTDTQTNIVKFRATGLDQKHNATNTNVDWKTVVTSDSQTQTADISDSVDFSTATCIDSMQFNDEFATIKISDPLSKVEIDETVSVDDLKCLEVVVPDESLSSEKDTENKLGGNAEEGDANKQSQTNSTSTSTGLTPAIKVDNGPSLHAEFISFLEEATDSATQTDPDMFEKLGGYYLGINLDNIAGNEKNVYVSVSSTASQTAVESVSSKSLSAEDYEALLNSTDDKKIADLQAFSDYIKVADCDTSSSTSCDETASVGQGQNSNGNDLLFDWENIVEEVYRDIERHQSKVSEL